MHEPRRAPSALVIALVGAESTGKTWLAERLADALVAEGRRVGLVDETLRRFCDLHGRTPRPEEQLGIARTQARRIEVAALGRELVIADTTALMTAVYSEIVFGDTSLYREAEALHGGYGLSLLTALDLPWVADGLQRDGPQVRGPVDRLVRASLQRSGGSWAVVSGAGDDRLRSAMAAVHRAWQLHVGGASEAGEDGARWHWHCERCGDASCERHALLSRLAADGA